MKTSLHTYTFEWDSVQFNVAFEFYPGCPATREEPGEDDFVEVNSIVLDGSDIELPLDMFCKGFQQALESECLSQVASDAADRFDALLTNDELMAYDR